jgi:hypothetical protein
MKPTLFSAMGIAALVSTLQIVSQSAHAKAPAPTEAQAAALQKVSAEMADAANAFLKSLDEAQAKKARYPFNDAERDNWKFVPAERNGLPIKEMKPEQRELARKLLETGMSASALVKIDTIMALEKLLGELEKRPDHRDPERYFTTIFGEPSAAATWGWRFEGHHIAVNFTLVGGKVISATPSFLAANRAETREGRMKGTRPLAREEDLARTLATVLHDSGKAVVYTEKPPVEILTGNERKATQLEAVGLSAKDMNDTQKEGLLTLISEYASRHRKEIAEKDMAKVKADLDNVRFGWAGGIKKGDAYYYRVQGTTFLIEACNIQNDANHIHTVWRDLEGDFGRDALGNHMKGHKDDH